MRIVLVFILWGIIHPLMAQFDKNYSPITSIGPLPQDFVTLSSQKYQTERQNLSKSEKKNIRQAKEEFILESSFGLDKILLSGNVLFNDPLGAYVNRVADKLMEHEPALKGHVRFYVFKSSAVNAFATDQGAIFVTMGMLAQLENESQLAFILAHEMIHYREKHAIEQFVEKSEITKGKGAYKNMRLDERILAQCAFSKEQEKEADEKGLQLLLKTQYSTAHLLGVYDVLKYALLPFDDITFDKSFLENEHLKFPDHYYLKTTRSIDTHDAEEDEESTHPSIKARRAKTSEIIKGTDNKDKVDYLVSEKEFEWVRESARFELCRLYLMAHRYESTIYSSYLLSRKYPENVFLKKLIGTSLVALAEYSAETRFGSVTFESDSVQGKSQALFHLLDKLDSTRSDLSIVAFAYVANLRKSLAADESIKALYEEALHTMVKKANVRYDYFVSVKPATDTTTKMVITVSDTLADELKQSKYDKLRAQETVESSIPYTHFTRYALIAFMNDTLKKDFERMENSAEEKKRISLDGELRKNRYYFNDKVVALGLKKVVVVDPYYARIDAEKRKKYRYLESEAGQVDFAERIEKVAKIAKLQCKVLNSKNLKSDDIASMNDITALEEYMNDRLAQDEDIDVPYLDQQRVKELAKKYGTTKFMLTGALSVKEKSRWKPLLIACSVLFPLSFPFTLPELVNGDHNTFYFCVVFDVQTDEVSYTTFRTIKNRTRGYVLNAHLYDVFNQLASTKKK